MSLIGLLLLAAYAYMLIDVTKTAVRRHENAKQRNSTKEW